MNKKKTIFISIGILILAGIVTVIIFLTEPKAEKTGATKETAMLVNVVEVSSGTFQPTFVTTGTVRPAQDIFLSPRISGEVIRISNSFIPGGYVKKGEVLLQIDPSDYRNTLELRKSDLSQAQADLSIEQGRQDVAEQDLELIGDTTLAQKNRNLVLRQPQLNAIKARVKAAQVSVRQAELNLQRTTIKAPFDAHILSRNVNVGSQVAPGDQLSRLIGMDEYWIVVTVPMSKLRWLTFPKGDDYKQGSVVRVRDRAAWAKDQYRTGHLYKRIGALEEQTRLARVLVTIPDPLGYETDTSNVPPLMIGSFMETNIEANSIDDVVRLERDYVRQNETVWVMDENDKLSIRDVDIILNDAKYSYIKEGLSDGERVVTTNLSTVTEGAKLRVEKDTTQSDSSYENDLQLENAN